VKEAFYNAFCLLTASSKTESPSILSRIITITKELVDRRIYVLGDKEFDPPIIDTHVVPPIIKKKKKFKKRDQSRFRTDKNSQPKRIKKPKKMLERNKKKQKQNIKKK